MDATNGRAFCRTPSSRRPLLGVTVLVVEDSRYASEAIRLLCLRSGARIRRAFNLETAHRHLDIYRPTVLIADIGLPDGSGISLIKGLAQAHPRIEVILALSGDPTHETAAIAAGADGFLAKPVESVGEFQSQILSHLPKNRHPPAPWIPDDATITPDLLAYHDDLLHITEILQAGANDQTMTYVTQFLGSVAQSAGDQELGDAAQELAAHQTDWHDHDGVIARLQNMIKERTTARVGA